MYSFYYMLSHSTDWHLLDVVHNVLNMQRYVTSVAGQRRRRRECCSWLHRIELLRQAQAKDGNSGHYLTGKQPAAIKLSHWVHSTTTRLHYHYIGIRELIRLWRLSQWLVTHGHHLAVTIYLHVAPSPGRHRRQPISLPQWKRFIVTT